jgi:hypothetical protein
MATLLQLVQQATGEMGLAVPASVSSSTATDIVQLMYLTNAVGYELAREFPWESLNREYRFYTAYAQSNAIVVNQSATITGIDAAVVAQMVAAGATNWMVTGLGINQDTYITGTPTATSVTVSQLPTASNATQLTFGQTKYPLPADWDRQTDRTHYDKSKRWEMLGPTSPQQWQFLKSSYISTGPRVRYRIMGGEFQIWPILSTNEYMGYEYISTAWADSAAGVAQLSLILDTDTCIYPQRLMVLGIKRKYFEIKGFDTSAFERDYQAELNIAKANDQGSATLSFAPKTANVLIGWENIPDSQYGA